MKIVSDFDGVLTEPSGEILRLREIFCELCEKVRGFSPQELIEKAEIEIDTNPFRYGWVSNGRISAYANEDGFIRGLAISNILDFWDTQVSTDSKGRKRSYRELSQQAYHQMVGETASGMRNPISSTAAEFLAKMTDRGNEVTIVSNSEPDRIIKILEAAKISLNSKIIIRGGAKKFELGIHPNIGYFGSEKIKIDINRPTYRQILDEENPDCVIGDVFSFDLALPSQIFKDKRGFVPVLKLSPDTPEYVQNMAKSNGATVIESLLDLL